MPGPGGQQRLDLPLPEPTFHQHNVWVPANPYLTEEIPRWLLIYSRASLEFDGQLKWELFRLPELECFQAMLNRLYRQELEELVLSYEAYRTCLQREIENRDKQEQCKVITIHENLETKM